MMTLGSAPLIAFLATTDAGRSKAFYRDALGLRLIDDTPFALEFDVGGTMLRIQKVERLEPHPFTALGWQVGDIAARIEELERGGVTFERFAGLDQDAAGVWTSPSGARIAWFKDPDGNVLSLTEFP
jgi:catechol 2,3-dioxygenase-like lactoylglutathione lyase family enzyme